MKKLQQVLLGLSVFAQLGCSSLHVTQFANTGPKLVLEDFFKGQVSAVGIFFKRSGDVSSRVKLENVGEWNGSTLILREHLIYDSGESHDRMYTINKLSEGKYEFFADEIVGKGTIESSGNALHWQYTLKENSKQSGGVSLTFDDWMFLQDDGTIIDRAQAYKYGILVGELVLSARKH